MNNFTIIGIDDKDHPELPEQARAAIATHHVFSGGKRHHEIMRDNLPEPHLWIDITVPLDDVFRQSLFSPPGTHSFSVSPTPYSNVYPTPRSP